MSTKRAFGGVEFHVRLSLAHILLSFFGYKEGLWRRVFLRTFGRVIARGLACGSAQFDLVRD
ncbi:hypothetical protein [Thioclava sp. DLFJ4-1]|uniref:hypothetical protein n=1 Tax=Thioclava sp. DLFJ4-1 TaxID=1915313 RepID=UPI000997D12E|nr:hypothetical protein [Thioclava sp. DLFJ4-1]OOY16191.1 hypothetical protein BMI85_11790 [Thioclava sp. DLFJ4-1]